MIVAGGGTDGLDETGFEPVGELMIVRGIANRENQRLIPKRVKFLIRVGPEEKIVPASVVGLAAALLLIGNQNGMTENREVVEPVPQCNG
jgi:hypothetical protein